MNCSKCNRRLRVVAAHGLCFRCRGYYQCSLCCTQSPVRGLCPPCVVVSQRMAEIHLHDCGNGAALDAPLRAAKLPELIRRAERQQPLFG